MYPTNNSAYLALSGIKLITKTMGQAETELTEGRVLMVMNSAGLIAPPVRGISQAFTWLLIGSFGKELFVLVLELMRVVPLWGRPRGYLIRLRL